MNRLDCNILLNKKAGANVEGCQCQKVLVIQGTLGRAVGIGTNGQLIYNPNLVIKMQPNNLMPYDTSKTG